MSEGISFPEIDNEVFNPRDLCQYQSRVTRGGCTRYALFVLKTANRESRLCRRHFQEEHTFEAKKAEREAKANAEIKDKGTV
jgi:hypothetical protein